MLTTFFEAHGIHYRVVDAPDSGLADAPGSAGETVCRSVLMRTPDGWRLAVIPHGARLDIAKARQALGEPRLRPASDHERAGLFPEFASGALPPVGRHYPRADLVDTRLLEHPEVLCAGEDPEHYLAIDPGALVRLARAIVADVCESADSSAAAA